MSKIPTIIVAWLIVLPTPGGSPLSIAAPENVYDRYRKDLRGKDLRESEENHKLGTAMIEAAKKFDPAEFQEIIIFVDGPASGPALIDQAQPSLVHPIVPKKLTPCVLEWGTCCPNH